MSSIALSQLLVVVVVLLVVVEELKSLARHGRRKVGGSVVVCHRVSRNGLRIALLIMIVRSFVECSREL